MPRTHSQPSLKIVTIDDSPLIAHRLKALIGDVGGVELLGNAETIPSALNLIEFNKPDVVFLDIHLSYDKPRNGIDLLNVLKKNYPLMKVIMLTNTADTNYRSMCKKLGADFFFDKSNDFDRIASTLEELRLVMKKSKV